MLRGRTMSATTTNELVDSFGVALDGATLAHLFCEMSPELLEDPVCGAELRRLASEDPDIIAAVADVDRSQIRDALERSPAERLRCAVNNWNGIARLRRAG
jgi:hypothetical protein